jgi:hypothetical protein
MLFHPVLVTELGIYFPYFPKQIQKQKMALKTWLPEQNMVIKYGYRHRKWSSNMVTGTNLFLSELSPT